MIAELLSQEAWRKAFLELSNRPQQTEVIERGLEFPCVLTLLAMRAER
jgi:hypothetical protein